MKIKVHTLMVKHEDDSPCVWAFETLDDVTSKLRQDLRDGSETDDDNLEGLDNWDHDRVLSAWQNRYEYADIEINEFDLDFEKLEFVKDGE